MRFKILIAVAVLLLPVAAFAQQRPGSPVQPRAATERGPMERAMAQRILNEVEAGLTCSRDVIALQDELAKAQARLKELEPKPEAKDKPDKPAK